jgi:hypothetical protein
MPKRATIEYLELMPAKSKRKPSILSNSLVMGLRGLPGIDGKQGIQGAAGIAGSDGLSIVGPAGIDGKQGTAGADGKPGAQGKAGRGIDSIKFGPGLAWVWIRWSDGTEETIQSEQPAGTSEDPKWLLDGASELNRVRDLIAGTGIVISEDNYGNFTISTSDTINRKTLTSSLAAISTDRYITIDASDNIVTYDLSGIESDGRQIDIYCIDSTFAVTLTGTVNGSDNPTMSQYDSFRMTYNASESSWELR